MASISACAVGSICATGALLPRPTTWPAITTTAPTGTSPAKAPPRARTSAWRMNCSSAVTAAFIIRKSTMAELEIHHEGAHESDPTGKKVGVMAAILAVFLAIVTIASHRTHTSAIMHKAAANDAWAHYQSTRV